MEYCPPTIIIRHRKENLKKCSLRGLEGRNDFIFLSYPLLKPFECANYRILTVDAEEELSALDSKAGLLILDGTWRYTEKMFGNIPEVQQLQKRRLPKNLTTAYPRRQSDCSHPLLGLASIEAIYLSYLLLKRPTQGLLDNYYWRELFLKQNENAIKTIG